MNELTSAEGRVVDAKLENIIGSVTEIKTTLADIGKALVTLVRVEERQAEQALSLDRANGKLVDHETRIGNVERDLPALRETRGWVIAGMLGAISLLLFGFFNGMVTFGRIAH